MKKRNEKKTPPKLTVSRETLRKLSPRELSQVTGGQNLCNKRNTSW